MSTGPQIRHEIAFAAAKRLEQLLAGSFAQFLTVGSVRRGKAYVGDVEHVIIPVIDVEKVQGEPNIFGQPTSVKDVTHNRLLERLDRMADDGLIVAARGVGGDAAGEQIDTETGEVMKPDRCWGAKQRRFLLDGIRHEVFLADGDNWGAIATIRTGPADFARMLVSKMRASGVYTQGGEDGKHRGYVVYAVGPSRGQVRSVPTEAEYLQLAGIGGWIAPDRRDGYMASMGRRV